MSSPAQSRVVLGIESGGTRTVALAASDNGAELLRCEFGPANLRLLDDRKLQQHFASIARAMPRPSALAIGMAGARTEQDRERIRTAAAATWKGVPCLATNDLETALKAAPPTESVEANVLILSGTGSCCFGQSNDGKSIKVGGWGHILGDKGSGYEIGLRGLKASIYHFDRDGQWPALGERLLRALMLNEPNDLITWAQTATKTDIAALAVEVFNAWTSRDKIASDILEAASNSLARDGLACATRLVGAEARVQFVLAGSVLTRQPQFSTLVRRLLEERRAGSVVTALERESVWGAVELAKTLRTQTVTPDVRRGLTKLPSNPFAFTSVASLKKSPTEMRNPRSMKLDRMSICDSIKLMLSEDARLPAALLKELPSIEKAVEIVSRSLRGGGRLFYVGAGTSGRLGVLDASECPPTFQTPPELVQGIIAGGQRALWQAVEGAEDDPEAGARAITSRGVRPNDVVVGIAASGRTPFVWGALAEARRRRARTVLLCFNPFLDVPPRMRPTVMIMPNIGPELLTGSTRLKSGTATKLVLNMLTTLAMVRLGKVMSNLMIDVKASNVKLRDRAARIVCELTGCDYAAATRALEETKWQIKDACRRVTRPPKKIPREKSSRPGRASRSNARRR
jgi:N-acetylmuramic acid 6-phosphate etherase